MGFSVPKYFVAIFWVIRAGIGLGQSGVMVAAYQGEVEDVKELRLRVCHTIVFLEFLCFFFAWQRDQCIVVDEYPRRFIDERKVIAKGFAQRLRDTRLVFGAIVMEFRDDPENPVGNRVKPIKAELVGDEGKDQDGTGDTGGKTENIDKRIRLVLPEIAPGDLEIIAEHGDVFDL